MNDLNRVTYYKASFRIKAKQDDIDILWEIVCTIRKWLTNKYNKDEKQLITPSLHFWTQFKNGHLPDNKEDNNKTVYCRSRVYQSHKDGATHWACKISETPEAEYDYAQRTWITSVVYRGRGPEGHFDLVLWYRDRAGYIGLYKKEPEIITVPRVIRMLLEHKKLTCQSAGLSLSASPMELKTGDGKILRDLIFNPARDLPLIYISPKKQEDKSTDVGILPISPEEVNKCIMGNAFVYFSKSIEFSEEAKFFLGDRYTCSNGDVRVYFPEITNGGTGNDERRHPLICLKKLEDWGKNEILTIFRKAFAQNSDFYKHILDYDTFSFMRTREFQQSQMDEKDVEVKKLNDRIAEIKNISEDEKNKLFELADAESLKFDSLSKDYNDLMGENDRLESEIKDLKNQVYTLTVQNQELNKKHAGGLADENSQKLLSHLQKMPSSCRDVVHIIEAMYPDRIAFTEKAYKSLDECVTEPALLWELLCGMATEFYTLLLDSSTINAADTFTKTLNSGFTHSRGAGSMTRKDKNLMRQYQDTYNQKTINIEAHFKKGNSDTDPKSVRVYYAWVPSDKKIVVGHCGKHLDNFSTRQIH